MINDVLAMKHWGWQNTSQESEGQQKKHQGWYTTKMINNALDMKHWGWQNMCQDSEWPQDKYQAYASDMSKDMKKKFNLSITLATCLQKSMRIHYTDQI